MTLMVRLSDCTPPGLAAFLRSQKVTPTAQRLNIAQILFTQHAHFSAEDVFNEVNKSDAAVSKATVYNTLGLFVERGLIKKVLVDPVKVFYDSNVAPHHHFYDLDSGKIQDIEPDQISLKEVPDLPDGTCLDSVEVVIRVRKQ